MLHDAYHVFLVNRVTYAETICLGLVSVAIFMTSMPLFQASGAMLSQMAPSGSSAAALNKCIRQVNISHPLLPEISTFSSVYCRRQLIFAMCQRYIYCFFCTESFPLGHFAGY